ncbi:MAG: hypothetical protein HY896_06295 [Deltaproteobacteria bacterium]|nr:hypothetical protein [Deltaproteobacteria bacterium]
MSRNVLSLLIVGVFIGAMAGSAVAEEVNGCLQMAKLEITQRTFPSSNSRAAGVVKRNAGDDGSRYLVQEVSGYFRAGDEISVYSIQGDFIGIGKVYSVYGDELYVDMLNVPPYAVSVGDEVFWNYTSDEAKTAIRNRKDVFLNVAAAARLEEEKINEQVAAKQRREEADRLRWQEDMTRLRLNLEAQYNAYYYSYRYHPFFYP